MFPFPFSFFGAAPVVPLELIDNNFAMEFDGLDAELNTTLAHCSTFSSVGVAYWGDFILPNV